VDSWCSRRATRRCGHGRTGLPNAPASARHGGTVETWCELTGVEAGLVSFRWTTVFEADGATLTSDSTLRYTTSDAIERLLGDTDYHLIEVREAPDRPVREIVLIARRRGQT